MILKKFEKQDYEIIIDWWKEHQHPIIPFNMLSPAGLILFNEQKQPICASFIYFVANCDIAQIAWTTTNPKAGFKEKYQAVNECIQGLIALARHNKRTNIMCFSDSSGLNKIFHKNGLKELRDHKLLYGSLGVF